MDDFLAVEPLLVQRIKEKVSGHKGVFTAMEIASDDVKQIAPRIEVIYAGFQIFKQNEDACAARLLQRWIVVPVVRNLRNVKSGEGIRSEAGPLISKSIEAVFGWKPSAQYTEMVFERAVPPRYQNGCGHFPIVFSTIITFSFQEE